jgi:hypothetical protein
VCGFPAIFTRSAQRLYDETTLTLINRQGSE